VVVKDVKEPVDPNTRTQFTTYYREISDYYPFGMLMEGRNWQSSVDRYGYNGMEQDDYLKENNQYLPTNPAFARTGTGNSYDYGARMYDSRVGRWMKRDPLENKYPSHSGYQFSLNSPIWMKDPDGKLVIFFNGMHSGEGGKSKYWDGYDKKVLLQVKDNAVRYYDGALGGKNALLNTINKIGIWGAFSKSSLSYDVRFEAGKNLGYNDAQSIFNNLSDGEVITMVSHSMGTAFERGFM
jgi:RHS repeat-associated protein